MYFHSIKTPLPRATESSRCEQDMVEQLHTAIADTFAVGCRRGETKSPADVAWDAQITLQIVRGQEREFLHDYVALVNNFAGLEILRGATPPGLLFKRIKNAISAVGEYEPASSRASLLWMLGEKLVESADVGGVKLQSDLLAYAGRQTFSGSSHADSVWRSSHLRLVLAACRLQKKPLVAEKYLRAWDVSGDPEFAPHVAPHIYKELNGTVAVAVAQRDVALAGKLSWRIIEGMNVNSEKQCEVLDRALTTFCSVAIAQREKMFFRIMIEKLHGRYAQQKVEARAPLIEALENKFGRSVVAPYRPKEVFALLKDVSPSAGRLFMERVERLLEDMSFTFEALQVRRVSMTAFPESQTDATRKRSP